MIDPNDFNVLNYVKKEEYTGSMDGMRYMLRRDKEEIEVIVWPEPNAYAYTDEELKIRKRFALSKEGVEEIADYLNSIFSEQKELWDLSNPNLLRQKSV